MRVLGAGAFTGAPPELVLDWVLVLIEGGLVDRLRAGWDQCDAVRGSGLRVRVQLRVRVRVLGTRAFAGTALVR